MEKTFHFSIVFYVYLWLKTFKFFQTFCEILVMHIKALPLYYLAYEAIYNYCNYYRERARNLISGVAKINFFSFVFHANSIITNNH